MQNRTQVLSRTWCHLTLTKTLSERHGWHQVNYFMRSKYRDEINCPLPALRYFWRTTEAAFNPATPTACGHTMPSQSASLVWPSFTRMPASWNKKDYLSARPSESSQSLNREFWEFCDWVSLQGAGWPEDPVLTSTANLAGCHCQGVTHLEEWTDTLTHSDLWKEL